MATQIMMETKEVTMVAVEDVTLVLHFVSIVKVLFRVFLFKLQFKNHMDTRSYEELRDM